MINKFKVLLNFLREHGTHSISYIPPIHAFAQPPVRCNNVSISLFPCAMPSVFLFTVDDVSEETNISDLRKLSKILASNNIKGTFFVIPYCNHAELSSIKALQIRDILKGHEFAQHGIWHTLQEIKLNDRKMTTALGEGKELLEKRLKTKILGYRSPNFLRNNSLLKVLSNLNFLYNSDQFLFSPNSFVRDDIVTIPAHDKCDPFTLGLDRRKLVELIKSKIKNAVKYQKPYVFLAHIYDLAKEANLNILDEIFKEANNQKINTGFSLSDFAKWWAARAKLDVKIDIKNRTEKVYLTNPTLYQLRNLKIRIYPLKKADKLRLYANNKEIFVKNDFDKEFELDISL